MTVVEPKTLSHPSSDLPKFRNPPVGEVALSLQFDALPGLQIHHFGLLWTKYRDRFPIVESHPPIDKVVETFHREPQASQGLSIELVNQLATPRVWFVTQSGRELLQVQRDRFVVNWRKVAQDDVYPHYEHIREMLEREYAIFEAFVAENKLGEIRHNQCEATYINQIQPCSVWNQHAQVGHVLNVMAPEFRDESLPSPELFRFSAQYVMRRANVPIGRLYLDFQPGFRPTDRRPIFLMNLTARGKPLSEHFDGALEFLDIARSNIVRGFRALTTAEMHKEWGLNG